MADHAVHLLSDPGSPLPEGASLLPCRLRPLEMTSASLSAHDPNSCGGDNLGTLALDEILHGSSSSSASTFVNIQPNRITYVSATSSQPNLPASAASNLHSTISNRCMRSFFDVIHFIAPTTGPCPSLPDLQGPYGVHQQLLDFGPHLRLTRKPLSLQGTSHHSIKQNLLSTLFNAHACLRDGHLQLLMLWRYDSAIKTSPTS